MLIYVFISFVYYHFLYMYIYINTCFFKKCYRIFVDVGVRHAPAMRPW